MTWDFAEGSPWANASGNWQDAVEFEARTIGALPAVSGGSAVQRDAQQPPPGPVVTSTDPPYYDNIGYADLADFFYVWLRRSLRTVYPELLATVLTPKSAELVADPFRHDGGRDAAERFFEDGFVRTFTGLRRAQAPGIPLTVFYAFKQAEDDDEGVASTGWETMLAGLMAAGLEVTATWPMRTELGNRMRNQASNALASSIVLACRQRSVTAGVTDKRAFVAALRAELPDRLRLMQQAAVAPVDLAQAAIGPGMAVYSRYVRVVEPSGEPMRVRSALALINEVLAEVLDEQEGEFDADTRWAVKWFEQYGFKAGDSGLADLLCRAYNTSIGGLVEAGIVRAVAGRTSLLPRSQLRSDWDPVRDTRIPVWEATQQLVKRLDEQGQDAAADLLHRLGGLGDAAHLLAYRLYSICERKGWAKEAGPYNALGAAWSDLQRQAGEHGFVENRESTAGQQGTMGPP